MPGVYIPVDVERRVREAARHRCGYCLSPHWLCCPICNRYKGDRTEFLDPETMGMVPLFHPRLQIWAEHLSWTEDGLRIIGLTPIGRATVAALHMDDDPDALVVRSYWIAAGWHPPKD